MSAHRPRKTFDVIIKSDRNRLWSRYKTQDEAVAAVAMLRRKGFDAWLANPDLDGPPKPVQLELQFD